MAELKGSKTHQHLKDAFAGESQANRRYLYFANEADIEGYPEVANLFRSWREADQIESDPPQPPLFRSGLIRL